MRDFKQRVQNSFAKFKVINGFDSKEMFHYVEPTLETGSYNTAIVHVGVNDLLKINRQITLKI